MLHIPDLSLYQLTMGIASVWCGNPRVSVAEGCIQWRAQRPGLHFVIFKHLTLCICRDFILQKQRWRLLWRRSGNRRRWMWAQKVRWPLWRRRRRITAASTCPLTSLWTRAGLGHQLRLTIQRFWWPETIHHVTCSQIRST